jgi:4-amino-4-deoxy-L-arabinose transferase-like glycosyltransferase
MFKKWFGICFVLILVLAAILRFWQLGQVPVSLYWDEAAMLVDVKSVVQTAKDMHGRPWYQVIYPSYGDYKLPVYIWLATLSAKFLGVNEFSLRLPSVLAGLGTVIVAGLIARELEFKEQGKWWQLATMAVIAFSPWSVMFSRTAFEGHVGQFWLALSVLLLLKSRHKPLLILLVSLTGALATYSYFSVRFVWPIVLVAFLFYFWWRTQANQRRQKIFSSLAKLFGALLFFGALLLPMQRSPLYADSNRFRLSTDSVLKNEAQVLQSNVFQELAGNTKWGRIIYHRYWLTFQELLRNYADNTSLNFLFVTGDSNLRHGTSIYGLFVWPLLAVWLLGLYGLWKHDKVLWLVLLAWWLAALLPASVPQTTPHALRSLNALVPLALILGWGLTQFYRWGMTSKQASLPLRKFVFGGYFLLIVLVTSSFAIYYFSQYPRLSAVEWQDGFKTLAQKIAEEKTPQKEVFLVPFDERFYLWTMAFGPYSGKDFQSWQSKGYQFQEFDGYHFSNYIRDQVVTRTTPFLLVGRQAQIEQELSFIKRKPTQVISVLGVDPRTQFLIADFK